MGIDVHEKFVGAQTMRWKIKRNLLSFAVMASTLFAIGCLIIRTGPQEDLGYDYFEEMHPRDSWQGKIERWQERALEHDFSSLLTSSEDMTFPFGNGLSLKTKEMREEHLNTYNTATLAQRRALIQLISNWIHEVAKEHYYADGPIDDWATPDEVFRWNGDDCDGLASLVFYLLREMGFPEGTVFNSFLYRTSDGKHHMFTLWFEDRENPWIIDSTGAMSSEAIRSSDLTGWRPLRTFSLAESYTVERRRRGIF